MIHCSKAATGQNPFKRLFHIQVAWLPDLSFHYDYVSQPCCTCSLMGILLLLACCSSLGFVLCLLIGRSHGRTCTARSFFLCMKLFKVVSLGTFGLPCRAHPGAVPFPPHRTYTVSRCFRSPKRRQPAEASNTRPLMSLSNVACEGSHMRYFGGLVSCPPYNLPLLRVWSQRSTARSLV